eukprot:GSMAST32.ASY1.ANO1.2742.1 assembled CDS
MFHSLNTRMDNNESSIQTSRYQIFGSEMQLVQCILGPGEMCIGEPGSFCYSSEQISFETSTGGGICKAISRYISGEGLFQNEFLNSSNNTGYVSFAAPHVGKIVAVDFSTAGSLICQRDAFLCGMGKIEISAFLQNKIKVGMFGGEGFLMQRISGNGIAFIHAGGTIVKRNLAPNEKMVVDGGCLVAYSESVSLDVKYVGSIKKVCFGGSGLFMTRVCGPGTVYIQSLPIARHTQNLMRAAHRYLFILNFNGISTIFLLGQFCI